MVPTGDEVAEGTAVTINASVVASGLVESADDPPPQATREAVIERITASEVNRIDLARIFCLPVV